MSPFHFEPIPLDELDARTEFADTDWLWHGYLARGNVTLLTSRWKTGKTTLVGGLLRVLARGGSFLGRGCQAAHAVVASEESVAHWRDRQKAIPIGPHVRLLSRPFPGRPTAADWNDFVARAGELRAARTLDLFVVDTLTSFLPGRTDSDPAALLDLLHPLRRLSADGVAVLVLHHPRKEAAEAGSAARGSGALLGFVDIILELSGHGTLPTDENRRKIVGLSRHADTPKSVVYEWTPGTPEFAAVADYADVRFRENWATLRAIFEGRPRGATHKDVLAAWPAKSPPPSVTQLYEWLGRAAAEGLAVRVGAGTKQTPYRFRLPDACDALTLPPLD